MTPPPAPVVRELITGKIAHYGFEVRIGPGRYDIVGLHRIVKESTPGHPVRAAEAILLLHGDALGFAGAFLGSLRSTAAPADRSLPVYLAQKGLDVWGIDQGWTRVPADEPDSSWAEDWGFDKELRGLDAGIRTARAVREGTDSGDGPIFLLGWSRGAQVILAYASAETLLPAGQRNVKGYVYADAMFKYTDPAVRQGACDVYDAAMAHIQAGHFADEGVGVFALLGDLANTAPGAPSPVFEGMDNRSAALAFGTFAAGYPYAMNYHLVAGIFNEAGIPVGLQYTVPDLFFDWLTGGAPAEPWQIEADGDAIGCERFDVPWDDHLDAITAPILYVEAAGGAGGDCGRQTLAFLPNARVTELIVQLHPTEERAIDFGHADLWLAGNAPGLVWRPILDWVKSVR